MDRVSKPWRLHVGNICKIKRNLWYESHFEDSLLDNAKYKTYQTLNNIMKTQNMISFEGGDLSESANRILHAVFLLEEY